MHDIDRTMLEFEGGLDEMEADSFEYGDEAATDYYASSYGESPMDETAEMELASELLEVTSDHELDQFLGKLIKKTAPALGRFVKAPAGKMLGGMLKNVAKKALPIAGTAIGGAFGGPVGASLGGNIASTAGNLLGLELEGLSPEDQEFEAARKVVKLAADASKKTAQNLASAPATQAVKSAVADAVRKHAPGIARGHNGGTQAAGNGRTGRWVRRGRQIILLGV
jgi:uncharacterized protein (DUF697 family)